MATLTAAANNNVEAGILRAAWSLLYTYLNDNRGTVFGRVGWGPIRFAVTGDRLLEILTPLFGGVPAGG